MSGGKSLTTTLVLLETSLLILIVGKRVMHSDVQFCHGFYLVHCGLCHGIVVSARV